jgi:hypothetical protein
MAWNLDVVWKIELAIFHSDGKGFTRSAVLQADNGGLLGVAFALAGSALQGDGSGGEVPSHISKRPGPSCELPTGATPKGALGLAACVGVPVDFGLGDVRAPGSGQSGSPFCKGIDDDVSHSGSMEAVAKCSVRVAMERATLAVQKEAKHVDGWRLFAPLQAMNGDEAKGDVGISLGRSEGVARGDTFLSMVPGENGKLEPSGFVRVVALGPGGPEGERAPSRVKWRAGEESVGTRMEEHAQIGVLFGLAPTGDMYVMRGDLTGLVAGGGAVVGGFNATRFVDVGDEFWSRVYFSMLFAKHTRVMSVDLAPELTF